MHLNGVQDLLYTIHRSGCLDIPDDDKQIILVSLEEVENVLRDLEDMMNALDNFVQLIISIPPPVEPAALSNNLSSPSNPNT